MTCIIGLEQDGVVYVGADSFIGDDETRSEQATNPKIFQKNGMLIACSGCLRAIQIVEHLLKLDNPKKFDEQYIIENIAEKIRLKFKDIDYVGTQENYQKLPTSFLIAYKDKMFTIEGNYALTRAKDGILCLGAGSEFAYGAMKALKNLKPEKRIKKSLKITSYYSNYVIAPFIILKTR